MLEDGSLGLVEEEEGDTGSGSGEAPTTSSPPLERQRRQASSFLTPMESMLPILPADVDTVVFSWSASASVSV